MFTVMAKTAVTNALMSVLVTGVTGYVVRRQQVVDDVARVLEIMRFRIAINKPVAGLTLKDGEFVESEVQHLDFVPEVLAAQLNDVSAKLMLYVQYKRDRALQKGETFRLSPFTLTELLKDAEIEIERTRFDVGDEYQTSDGETHTHEHVGYNTRIASVKLAPRIEQRIDLLVESIWN
jgi:hypothetical protein